MRTRGGLWASVSACALGLVFILAFVVVPVDAQKKDVKKLDKDQLQEAQALAKALDAVETGGVVPADVTLTLEDAHFFKATSGQTYVPFTVDVDAASLASPAVTMMLRVIRTDVPAGSTAKPANAPAVPTPTFEDLYFVDVKPAAPGAPARLSRAFQAPAGEYDLYVALKERNPVDKKKPKMAVVKRTVSIPDFWGKELSISSLIVAEKVGASDKLLNADQQRENPYTIGQLQIVPKVGTKFAKADELTVYFQIYNPALDAAGKPDVVVEGAFYQKNAAGEKKIFNTDPSAMNAGTLPPQFNSQLNPLPGGGAWGLTSFPPGDYRVEFKVTDKLSGKSLTKSVAFSVS